MNFQFLTSEITAIKTFLNSLKTNAKRIFELPEQTTLDLSSKIHVSRGGVDEQLELQLFANSLLNNTQNRIISIDGTISKVLLDVIVPPLSWSIQNVIYNTATDTTLSIDLCETGFSRKDIIVATNSGTIILVNGVESDDIVLRPSIPLNSVLVTELDVSDSDIGSPTDPLLGEAYIKKIFSNFYAYPVSGTNQVLPIRPDGTENYTLTNSSLVSVDGFDLSLITGNSSAEIPFIGKKLIIWNQTGNDVTLNDAGSAEIPFNFGINIVIPTGEKILLFFDGTEIRELFKSWNELTIPDEDIYTYFRGDLFMCQPTGASLSNFGYSANPTLTGTGTNQLADLSVDYAVAPYQTWYHRRQISSSVSGSSASAVWQQRISSVGHGFYFSAKVNCNKTTDGRFFFGLTNSLSELPNDNPSTAINIAGIGIDSGDSNLQIMHNDGLGIATKLDIGSNFSINSTNNTYVIEIFNFQLSTSVFFRIKNLLTNFTSEKIEVTTNLPSITTGLAAQLWANNGTTAASTNLHFSNHTYKRQS